MAVNAFIYIEIASTSLHLCQCFKSKFTRNYSDARVILVFASSRAVGRILTLSRMCAVAKGV